MVYAAAGSVVDVVVDLRVGSPTYGQYHLVELSASRANALYIPKGLAHGFYVPSGEAVMVYKVTSLYSPVHDSGILWNSVDIPWPEQQPVLSERDHSFTPFEKFQSPFRYEPDTH